MTVRETEIDVKQTVKIFTCDICGKESEKRMHQCTLCKKDICDRDTHLECSEGSDYTTYYCHRCWSIGEKYREEIREEYERHEKVVNDIHKRWNDEAKS